MERSLPGFLTTFALARLAGTSRWHVHKLIASGVVSPFGTVDYGRKSTPIFRAEDAILVAEKIHGPKSATLTDATST